MMDIALLVIFRFLELYELVILVRCILSFFGYNEAYAFLCKITDPVLNPIRNIIMKTPLGNMPLDFSPVIAMILIGVIERCLVLLSKRF